MSCCGFDSFWTKDRSLSNLQQNSSNTSTPNIIDKDNFLTEFLKKEGPMMDKNLAQHQLSMLLFVAFACGLGMLLLTKLLGIKVLTAFTGSKNLHLIPASNTYVQIRGFAWPAVLVGIVAQSASLGMKDSWGPLKALAVASTINGVCDVLLCLVCSYGIAGAAWATMLSQLVAAFMMLKSLNKTGFRAFQFSIPTPRELLEIFAIATPMFMTTASKVGFYGLLTYFATSMGMMPAAAHQVMINLYCMCCVWGEPLSQTAQSFMPELIYGVNRSLSKARILLKSLVVIGAMSGLMLGIIGTSIPWFFPYLFTSDYLVAREMHKLLLPCFVALMATPPTNSLEGTLVASGDLKFFGLTMTGCFCCSWLLLLLLSSRSCSLSSCWWVLAVFQLVICFNSNAFATFFWFERYTTYFSFYLKDKYHNLINDDRCKLFQARLLFASLRLVSPYGLFYRKDSHQQGFVRAKGT